MTTEATAVRAAFQRVIDTFPAGTFPSDATRRALHQLGAAIERAERLGEKTFTLAEVKAAFMRYLDIRSDQRPKTEDSRLNSWALLCSEAGLLLLGTDTLPEEKTHTPREREPAVWAAAYGAAFVAAYLDAVSATDGQGDERTERALADVHVARCRRIADAAVLALEASR